MRIDRGGFAFAILLAITLVGCNKSVTQLRIESHRPPNPPAILSERFPEAWFAWDAHGNVDLILKSVEPSALDGDGQLLQVFWARMFWKPVPGTTYAERTQTNANFGYAILDLDRTVSYEGAGFIYMSLNQAQTTMSGSIESGTLA